MLLTSLYPFKSSSYQGDFWNPRFFANLHILTSASKLSNIGLGENEECKQVLTLIFKEDETILLTAEL